MEAEIEAKASLARAYAAGETPEYISVAPTGRDEFWRLAGTLFIVPSIPSDAPATLEYALRLHRDALFTGQCENCSATVDVTSAVDVEQLAVAQSLIRHKRSCPAFNETLMSELRAHHDDKASKPLGEALDAASARTRNDVETALADRSTKVTRPSFHDWARGVLDEKGKRANSDCCDHLQADPAQTWHYLFGQSRWRCDECWAYFQQEIQTGRWRLPHIEDHSCDKCGRFAPSTLEALVLRIGIFVLHGGLCGRCSRESQEDGPTTTARGR